jgi:hypothetical protein
MLENLMKLYLNIWSFLRLPTKIRTTTHFVGCRRKKREACVCCKLPIRYERRQLFERFFERSETSNSDLSGFGFWLECIAVLHTYWQLCIVVVQECRHFVLRFRLWTKVVLV